MNRLKSLTLPAVAFFAGAVTPFAFAPFGLWPLQIACLAILISAVLHTERARTAFYTGWAYGTASLIAGLYWLYVSMHTYGGMPSLLAGAAVVCLALFLGIPAADSPALSPTVLSPQAGKASLWISPSILIFPAVCVLAESACAAWIVIRTALASRPDTPTPPARWPDTRPVAACLWRLFRRRHRSRRHRFLFPHRTRTLENLAGDRARHHRPSLRRRKRSLPHRLAPVPTAIPSRSGCSARQCRAGIQIHPLPDRPGPGHVRRHDHLPAGRSDRHSRDRHPGLQPPAARRLPRTPVPICRTKSLPSGARHAAGRHRNRLYQQPDRHGTGRRRQTRSGRLPLQQASSRPLRRIHPDRIQVVRQTHAHPAGRLHPGRAAAKTLQGQRPVDTAQHLL